MKRFWAKAFLLDCALFDPQYYLDHNPDVAQMRIDPLSHFLYEGGLEGRKPCAEFDSAYYLAQNSDVRRMRINPLIHYLFYGWREGRNPAPDFDTTYYLKINPDIKQREINPLVHYVIDGKKEQRLPIVPFSEYSRDAQTKAHTFEQQRCTTFPYQPLITIITPVYNTPQDLLRKMLDSVVNQTYPHWELSIVNDGSTSPSIPEILAVYSAKDARVKPKHLTQNQGITEATNEAIRSARGEFLAFVDHDDELTCDALFEVVKFLNIDPETDVIYSDQDKIGTDGVPFEPFFKPDWSPEFFRGVMYVGHLLVTRKALVEKVGLLDKKFERIQDYELMLRLSEHTQHIRHIPQILYHWRQIPGSVADAPDAKGDLTQLQERAVNAHLTRLKLHGYAKKTGEHRVRIYPLKEEQYPRVSILIPTKDHPELLQQCLGSIFALTTYPNVEVIVIDNQTTDKQAIQCMQSFPIQRVPFDKPFNFSAINNWGVTHATGDYLIFLNNDIEVVTADWIQNLLYYAQQPDIGAVGPLLIFPNGQVQHAGVVLGFRGTADHIMRNYPGDADGYYGSLCCARETSAVTAACLMMNKALFLENGGFNIHYASVYQDVDLCLQLRAKGYRNIYTPTAVLKHHESSSRGNHYHFVDRVLLLDRWQDTIEKGDPYYNPNFDLSCYTPEITGYTIKRR